MAHHVTTAAVYCDDERIMSLQWFFTKRKKVYTYHCKMIGYSDETVICTRKKLTFDEMAEKLISIYGFNNAEFYEIG